MNEDPDFISAFKRYEERLDKIDEEFREIYTEISEYSENFDKYFKTTDLVNNENNED